MLPGFLTTALEIIIILDVVGAIAYFTITGLTRKKDGGQTDKSSVIPPLQPAPIPALAFEGLAPQPAAVPARISPSVYAPKEETSVATKSTRTDGLKSQFTYLKDRFAYKHTAQTIEKQDINTDYNRLGRVLDSCKEDA